MLERSCPRTPDDSTLGGTRDRTTHAPGDPRTAPLTPGGPDTHSPQGNWRPHHSPQVRARGPHHSPPRDLGDHTTHAVQGTWKTHHPRGTRETTPLTPGDPETTPLTLGETQPRTVLPTPTSGEWTQDQLPACETQSTLTHPQVDQEAMPPTPQRTQEPTPLILSMGQVTMSPLKTKT